MTQTRLKVRPYPYKHGMSDTRIFRIFRNMKTRCSNIKEASYKQYGAKGIKVEWADFQSFYNDMGKSYLQHVEKYGEKLTTIDRIDSKGNYSKANCRWATPHQQSRNTEQNRFIKFKGKTQCLSDWADELGIKRTTLIMRIDSYGWSIEKALTTGGKSFVTARTTSSS